MTAKVKVKNGYLVIRIPLHEVATMMEGPRALLLDQNGTQPKARKPKAPLEHTVECVQRRAAEFTFTKQWPVHCRTCNARGYIMDNATGQKRTCPRCLEFGICARCGNSALRKVSGEEGTYYVCTAELCQWNQADAFLPSAEAAGLAAPVWRCTCEQENADA